MSLPEQNAAPDGVKIDSVTVDDLPFIVGIDAENTGESKADFWYGCYARQNSDPKSTFLVARLDGEVVGYVFGGIQAWEFGSPPCGWVEAVAVARSHRKLQIGTMLFDAVVEYFKANGIFTVRTMLHIDDHLLISFFRMQGMAAGPYIQLEMQAD